jgi:rhodanese-related sulfurtransferase
LGGQRVVEQIPYARLAELLQGAHTQLVEVLPDEVYSAAHLPRAINIPLKLLDADATAGLDRTRPVVVYCWDSL